MPPTQCQLCNAARALVKRPKTGQQVCKSCFFEVFETEVHNTIVEGKGIFTRGEKVAIGASGGKGMSTLYHGVHADGRFDCSGSCSEFVESEVRLRPRSIPPFNRRRDHRIP
jgi:hypothetical protein